MRKAVLILDMPSSCLECPIGKNMSISIETCIQCPIGKCSVDAETKTRPDWCPLRELMEKKDLKKALNMTGLGWIEGYNACIDELLKEE